MEYVERAVYDEAANALKILKEETKNLADKIPTKSQKNLEEIYNSFKSLVENLKKNSTFNEQQIDPKDIGFPGIFNVANYIGSGGFGDVYWSKFKGSFVAIKIIRDEKDEVHKNDLQEEIKFLRSFRHDNIVAYRGSGMYEQRLFLVMEYIKETLLDFINSRSTHDGSGVAAFLTWHISSQVANGLNFLHSLHIVHRDLKPDNILLDTSPVYPRAKLCDFGCSWRNESDERKGHVRYRAKEEPKTIREWMKYDVFSFGLVVLHTRTGKRPWDKESTHKLEGRIHVVEQISTDEWYIGDIKVSDTVIGGELGKVIKQCCSEADGRPSFSDLTTDYFSQNNPYKMKETKGEFFSCGFLTNTNIFVADSMVAEDDTPSSELPKYQQEDLMCPVDKETKRDKKLENEKDQAFYHEKHKEYKKMATEGVIDNNVTIALKQIVTTRGGDEEKQRIELRFAKSTYCHHRAMRDVWRSFEVQVQNKIVPCKTEVNRRHSTSFGLHVAVLTNEPNGKKKFIFTQRSKKKGMASPGAFTCGAVESCSVKDCECVNNPESGKAEEKVSLLKTAARGLNEELGLVLEGNDMEAIHLNTLYLKFDNHEWGMCGFVDLTDEKIQPANRFSYEQLNTAFTCGAKDKFEHSCIYGVDFDLETMVGWIRENHLEMASSAKIVVVKVLQAFFGISEVTKKFENHL